jgi:hypothetical protein
MKPSDLKLRVGDLRQFASVRRITLDERLRRRIEAPIGGSTLRIIDPVENLAPVPTPPASLYYCTSDRRAGGLSGPEPILEPGGSRRYTLQVTVADG